MRFHCLLTFFITFWALSTVLADWNEGPYFHKERKHSSCGRDVRGRRFYLNEVYQLNINQIGHLLLAPFIYTRQYKNILEGTQYERLAKALGEPTTTPWSHLNQSWFERNMTFGREVYDQPLIKHADLSEHHVDYCVIPLNAEFPEGDTKVEIDIGMKIENAFLELIAGPIEETASTGFVEVYGSLNVILKYLAEHPEDAVFSVDLGEILIQLGENKTETTPRSNETLIDLMRLKTTNRVADVARRQTTPLPALSSLPSLAKSSGNFWKYLKYALFVAIIVSFVATVIFIAVRLYTMPREEEPADNNNQAVTLLFIEKDDWENIELKSLASQQNLEVGSLSPVPPRRAGNRLRT